jgi:hypothetical protein
MRGEAGGDRNALDETAMQLKIQSKVTYGFLILALGLMVTDFCRLMRAPSDTVLAAANTTHHARKF